MSKSFFDNVRSRDLPVENDISQSRVPDDNPSREVHSNKPEERIVPFLPTEPPLPPRRPEGPGSASLTETSEKLLAEVHVQPITSLTGSRCKKQPHKDEIPVLEFGKKLEGCHYFQPPPRPDTTAEKAARTDKKPEAATGLDMKAAYSNALKEAVYLDIYTRIKHREHEFSGSGVVVGQTDNKTFILTDAHVVNPKEGKIEDRFVVTNEGQAYPMRVLRSDKKFDMALIEVGEGSKNIKDNQPFQIASVAQDGTTIERGDPIVFAGYPEDTVSLYMSPGKFHAIHHQSFTDNVTRRVLNLNAKGSFGNSGGPVFDASHKVIGLIEGGSKKDMDANIMTKSLVDKWLKPYGIKSR